MDRIRNAGASPYASYPSKTPGKYTTDEGNTPIQLDIDKVTKSGDSQVNLTPWRKKGGFSGPVSDD